MINVNKTPFTDDLFKYKTRTRKNAKYTTHNEILKQSKIHHTSEPQKRSIRTTIYEIKTYTNLSFIISIIVNPRKPCEIQHSHIILRNDIIENFRNSNEWRILSPRIFLAAFPLKKEAITEDYRSEVVKYSNFYMTTERIHRIKECFHSHGQPLCKIIETKESVYIRKESNSHGTGLGHQYGRRDVMWKHSITQSLFEPRIIWEF